MIGSKGRVGLYEILAVSSDLKAGIEHGLGERELQKVAGAGDFLPMRRYARFLLDNALVDPDELVKVFPRKVERNEKAMFGALKTRNQPTSRPAPKKPTATKKKSAKRSTRKK
jgi:hypothetical protein